MPSQQRDPGVVAQKHVARVHMAVLQALPMQKRQRRKHLPPIQLLLTQREARPRARVLAGPVVDGVGLSAPAEVSG